MSEVATSGGYGYREGQFSPTAAENAAAAGAHPVSPDAVAWVETVEGKRRAVVGGHALLDRVAEIVRAAAAEHGMAPEWVSKASFDAARDSLGIDDAPTAEAIRQRFDIGWRLVVQAALTDPANRGHFLGHRQRRPEAEWDPPTALHGVRRVARLLGKSPSVPDYDHAVEQIEAAADRNPFIPAPDLPAAATLTKHFGSWAQVLAAAGLPPTQPTGPPSRRARPALETLDEFISAHGLLPQRSYFEDWCRAHDVPCGRDTKQWDQLVDAVRDHRTQRGEDTPTEATPARDCPALPDPPATPTNRAVKAGHSRDAALASLRRYGERYLTDGRLPRYKHYQACVGQDPELLAASVVARHGRFQDLCREAGL